MHSYSYKKSKSRYHDEKNSRVHEYPTSPDAWFYRRRRRRPPLPFSIKRKSDTPLRIKQRDFLIPPPHQALELLTARVHVLLHLLRGSWEIVLIERLGNLLKSATAEIVGETDQGVQLILVNL
jgi:hypothetical protein